MSTYVLQAFATAFMLGAIVLMAMSLRHHNWMLFGINFLLFAANGALFIFQWYVRSTYGV